MRCSVSAEEAERSSAGLWLQQETKREDTSGGDATVLGQVYDVQRAGREEHVHPAAEWRESQTSLQNRVCVSVRFISQQIKQLMNK